VAPTSSSLTTLIRRKRRSRTKRSPRWGNGLAAHWCRGSTINEPAKSFWSCNACIRTIWRDACWQREAGDPSQPAGDRALQPVHSALQGRRQTLECWRAAGSGARRARDSRKLKTRDRQFKVQCSIFARPRSKRRRFRQVGMVQALRPCT